MCESNNTRRADGMQVLEKSVERTTDVLVIN